mgnify:CR=1 FL=1
MRNKSTLVIALLLIANLAALGAGFAVWRLVRDLGLPERTAGRAAVLMAIFPAAKSVPSHPVLVGSSGFGTRSSFARSNQYLQNFTPSGLSTSTIVLKSGV